MELMPVVSVVVDGWVDVVELISVVVISGVIVEVVVVVVVVVVRSRCLVAAMLSEGKLLEGGCNLFDPKRQRILLESRVASLSDVKWFMW